MYFYSIILSLSAFYASKSYKFSSETHLRRELPGGWMHKEAPLGDEPLLQSVGDKHHHEESSDSIVRTIYRRAPTRM